MVIREGLASSEARSDVPLFDAIPPGIGEGRVDVVARLCMVVDWCIDHPEYTAKIKVIPKKDYPILMPCEF